MSRLFDSEAPKDLHGRTAFLVHDGTGTGKSFQAILAAKAIALETGEPALVTTRADLIPALKRDLDRLGLDEAASFVAVLRHSVELGGDVATTLREFSEDMRSRRMLLAEKKANELPVKMVIPLALGIFPVILMICLLPVMLKLLRLMAP